MAVTEIKPNKEILLAHDLASSFGHYARSVILDRALPDIRDGLKPVHRRILYAMYAMGLFHNRPHRKSARVVGEVLGKYHPHGDQSVYDAMVRMAQSFAMRYPLVDGQGNFGSIDGDNAAAMRYTEARMSEIADLMLQDIEMDTVRWQPNFDDSLQEPVVLPAVIPNLLVNGSSGIAVAMSTNIPPHNLDEICNAVTFICKQWKNRNAITVDDLMGFVKGPDFPTGGLAFRFRDENGNKTDVIREMYETGEGKITMQAEVAVEEQGGGKSLIVITALPYMVQKDTVMARIGAEVRKGRIEGVADVRDESDHEGMRLVVETLRGHDPAAVLEMLLQYSQLRETFGAQMLALVPTEDGMKPRNFSLREALCYFVSHRLQVIERRSRYERKKREERLHIVEGLLIALTAIDEVVNTIRRSRNRETAKKNLKKLLEITDAQVNAIVAMPLGNLAQLEVTTLRDEAKKLKERIKYLSELIKSESARLNVIVEETEDAQVRFASPRRTRIVESEEHAGQTLTTTDLTEPQIVSIYSNGTERRDCAGYRDNAMVGLTSRRTSVPIGRWYADPADRVIIVADDGECWHDKTISIGDGVVPKGKSVVGGGIITDDVEYIVTVTKEGQVKRTRVDDLHTSWGTWARLIGLNKGDKVVAAGVDSGNTEIMIFTRQGQAIRFKADVNPQQSATARGVGGMKVAKDDEIIAANVFNPDRAGHVVILSEKGWLKRVPLHEWPIQGRNGKGVQSLGITSVTGPVMAAAVVHKDDNYVDFITEDGRRLRFKYEDLPEENRRRRGIEAPALLKKADKKDKTTWEDVGRVIAISSLSTTYSNR